MNAKLFADLERLGDDDLPPRLSNFEYLSLSNRPEAGRTRQVLTEWLQHFPASHRAQLTEEIQSGDDIRFDSAVFELAVATIIQFQGNDIEEIEPQIGSKGRNPDFLCRSQSGTSFVVECADARQLSAEDEGKQKHLDDLINAINEIPGKHHRIYFRYSDRPPLAVRKSRIQQLIRNWLSQLDENADFGGSERLEFDIDGIHYKCDPMKTRSEIKNIVGAYGRLAAWSSSQPDSLRRSLKKKSTRYGDLSQPYIIALNAPSCFHPHEDLFDVLFGTPAVSFDPKNPLQEVQETRLNDGVWAGPKGWANTRVSGILLASNLGAWSAAMRNLWYFEHPFSAHSMDSPFPDICCIRAENGEVSVRDGTPSREIFGLEAGWPE